MIAGYLSQQVVFPITAGSVAGGTANLPILVAPFGGITIGTAIVTAQTTVAAGTVNYPTLTLLNGGTAGTATTAIGTAAGTVGILGGGTITGFTLNAAALELTVGQYLMAKIAETGNLADQQFSIILTYVRGQG